MSDDYKNADGSLNTSSALVSTINCLKGSRVGTNLGGPVKAARQHLETSGRPDVKQGIILFTDGAANRPGEGNPCFFAGNQADLAKNQDIEIFTIGFGVGNVRCLVDNIAPYENELVTRLLADMATDSDNDGCTKEENADGDHFLCESAGADLESVFTKAARVLAAGVSLVYVPK